MKKPKEQQRRAHNSHYMLRALYVHKWKCFIWKKNEKDVVNKDENKCEFLS